MKSVEPARKDRRSEYYGDWRARVLAMLRNARKRAEAHGVPFDLTPEFVLDRLAAQSFACARTGVPLCIDDQDPDQSSKGRRPNPWAPSLDRINASGGYTPKNVQVVCWMYNACKQVSGDHDVMLFAHSLLTHQRSRPSQQGSASAAMCPARQP